jgi:hypothetical protein
VIGYIVVALVFAAGGFTAGILTHQWVAKRTADLAAKAAEAAKKL